MPGSTVLGLHFGHDAHACIFSDGRLLSCVHRERISGVKHHAGLNKETINACLEFSQISLEDITHTAITNTQYREFIFEDPEFLSFIYGPSQINKSIDELFEKNIASTRLGVTSEIADTIKGNGPQRLRHAHQLQYPDLSSFIDKNNASWKTKHAPYLLTQRDELNAITTSSVERHQKLSSLEKWAESNLYMPVQCQLGTRLVPGLMIDHHYAHCCSSAAKANSNRDSLIFSADGSGASLLGNLAAVLLKGKLYPFLLTSFSGGQFYEAAADQLGLDCGKFMGLSGYGKPSHELLASIPKDKLLQINIPEIINCLAATRWNSALSLDDLLSKNNVDFAATCQSIFELQYIYIIQSLKSVAKSSLGRDLDNIILSGGCALNCPSNALLAEKYGYENIYIEPACTDEGLAVGAAIATINVIDGSPLSIDVAGKKALRSPYLGMKTTNKNQINIEKFCADNSLELAQIEGVNWPQIIAHKLLRGDIGFIIKGTSEVGPRALGNRSIVAYPKNINACKDVNNIKLREQWRPLAPAVLESSFDKLYFGPKNPYMLMTNSIKKQSFPSTTHVDGSARVQVVYPENENFYKILTAMENITHDAEAILNTSFNRKNEAIINTLDTALDFFLVSKASFILLDQYIVSKNKNITKKN